MLNIDILYIHNIWRCVFMKTRVCCFLGHRKITQSQELKEKLQSIIEKLIMDQGVDTFLFGSHSEFDDLCLAVVTEIKIRHPHINRIFVRTQYPELDDYNKALFTKGYDDTYFPEKIKNAGKYVYVERNYDMIDKSWFCIFYYNENVAKQRKSGTKIAYDYAIKRKKEIINVY